MKYLVIQQKMIGDVLATSIICNNLKRWNPDNEVHYLVYPFTVPVIENNPNIDRIVLYKEGYRKNKRELIKFLRRIRREKYDVVIDAYGKLESNLVTAFSGAGTRIGFHKTYTNFLYTTTVREIPQPLTNAGTAIENRLNLIKALGILDKAEPRPQIFLTNSEIENGRKLLDEYGIDPDRKIYMIGVLGSGENKTYPFKYMAELLDVIVSHTGAVLLFNYIPKQRQQAEAIYALCKPETQQAIRLDLVPGGLREFMSLCMHCDALIGNEGGAVNMAKALFKPTFTIFSTWIKKEAWSSFDDGKTHTSVHLQDFRPELYGTRSPKEMKSEAMKLYDQMLPGMIIPKLVNFLENN